MQMDISKTCRKRGREMIFLSHTNPEDNLFTRWLALRLAREGFPVWCDLTRSLGGEDFWRDIEVAIREGTAKFLFVLSKTSNQKQGTLMELTVARKVGRTIHDFIIPLRIDDIRQDDINIELQRLNCIDFFTGWATGYGSLLKRLQDDGIGRDPRFSPDAVTKWWRDNYSVAEGVTPTPERSAFNWFEFSQLAAHHLESYLDALAAAICVGGDCDTNAAIVGGIVATAIGREGIPSEWLNAKEPFTV